MPSENQMRWDPILREWVIVASNRTARPVLGKVFEENSEKEPETQESSQKMKKKEIDSAEKDTNSGYTCPFCPGSPEVPDADWKAKQLGNRFAALQDTFEDGWSINSDALFPTRSALGKCEVILYTPEHHRTLGEIPIADLYPLADLWKERYEVLAQEPALKYVYIFENRGEAIGVSLEHPHGQIYALPYLPPKIQRKRDSLAEYKEKESKCLFCDVMEKEMKAKVRILAENDSFVAFVPYFAHWPYEVDMYAKRHVSSIAQFTQTELHDFMRMMKELVLRYDTLRQGTMSYVMSLFNAPVNCSGQDQWHFHVEFYPLYRGPGRIKHLAGVELGCGTIINPLNPESAANHLKSVKIDLDF